MEDKHVFEQRAFRRLRLPYLMVGLLPGFIWDGFLIYHYMTGQPVFGDAMPMAFRDLLTALLISAVILTAFPVIPYLRLYYRRKLGYIRKTSDGAVYRRSKLMGSKTDWKNGYAFNDDYYIQRLKSLHRTRAGGIVAYGTFDVMRHVPETEALYTGWKVRRVAVPAYFSDMDGLAAHLKKFIQ